MRIVYIMMAMNSDEPILRYATEDYESALEYFSHRKSLPPTEFLQVFRIREEGDRPQSLKKAI